MKYSLQFSDAIHILAYIEIFQNSNLLSSEMIAKSIETSAANVRKIMSKLKKSGLIITQNGKAAPSLARKPEKITLLDVYQSIEGNTNLIQVDPKTNPNCVVGANIQEALTESYFRLQEKVEREMEQMTLAELIHKIAVLENEHRPENQEIIEKFL
ncbi:Rrf2 family transcriptional regulator [Enterococcus durans]|uniref:Rrf2 family transcriptional regulator n=1 Tax=Enterococcus durans TaxID=53345 RepID=UPI0011BFE0FF|nr:Rrf2 family transcriptional regulator [Enterococcus durans]NJE63595.1 Rrf2 family transcriptional regulator [Enterococcus durans]QED58473.1 Rrf2 family transcriptional regulator [Enterococcus durans]QED61234.1 Rrf2 family transcriptional regulator [Enterococcus durans]